MHKLQESIPSTNMKIIELFNKIESGLLVLDPSFQRKLVWKKQHKIHFIETILKNYPFPEIYIASSEIDIEKITNEEMVVDGQQRLSTIIDYIKERGDFKNKSKIEPFDKLSDEDKKKFLNYLVSVRDLKDMNIKNVKEIFKRINNTEYSLNAIEKINAQYGDGEFIIFCKQLIDEKYSPSEDITDIIIPKEHKKNINIFFIKNNIFNENDTKRMIALQFIMSIVVTILDGDYFRRSEKINSFIEDYNERFIESENIINILISVIDFISKISLDSKSYWFNKSNIFTLIIELSKVNIGELNALELKKRLDVMEVKSKKYFGNIEIESINIDDRKYFEYAKEGVNEKKSRLHRAKVIREIINNSKMN